MDAFIDLATEASRWISRQCPPMNNAAVCHPNVCSERSRRRRSLLPKSDHTRALAVAIAVVAPPARVPAETQVDRARPELAAKVIAVIVANKDRHYLTVADDAVSLRDILYD